MRACSARSSCERPRARRQWRRMRPNSEGRGSPSSSCVPPAMRQSSLRGLREGTRICGAGAGALASFARDGRRLVHPPWRVALERGGSLARAGRPAAQPARAAAGGGGRRAARGPRHRAPRGERSGARARATAERIGARLGLVPRFEAALRELDVGRWSGLHRAEIERRWPDELARFRAGDLTLAPGGGESRLALRARAARVLARARAGGSRAARGGEPSGSPALARARCRARARRAGPSRPARVPLAGRSH